MAELPADAIAKASPEPAPSPDVTSDPTPSPAKKEASPPPPPPPKPTSSSDRTEITVSHCIPCTHESPSAVAVRFVPQNTDSQPVFVAGTDDKAAQDHRAETERESGNCGIPDHVQRGACAVGWFSM